MFPLQALLLCHIKKCISIEPGACKEKNSIKFMKVKSKWGLSDLWINPCGWDITIPIHTTLLSKQYLFIKKEPENDLDLSCTPLGLQHCNAVLPSLKISGSELYSEEQQQSAEGDIKHNSCSCQSSLSPSSIRPLLHRNNRSIKSQIYTLQVFIIKFLITGLEFHFTAYFSCKFLCCCHITWYFLSRPSKTSSSCCASLHLS